MDEDALSSFSQFIDQELDSHTSTIVFWWEILRESRGCNINALRETVIRLDRSIFDNWTPWQKLSDLLVGCRDLSLETGLLRDAPQAMPHWLELSEDAKDLISFYLFELTRFPVGTAEILPQAPDERLEYFKSRFPDHEDEWRNLIPQRWPRWYPVPRPIDLNSDSVFVFDLTLDLSKDKSELMSRIGEQIDTLLEIYRGKHPQPEQVTPLPCNQTDLIGRTNLRKLLAYFELKCFGSYKELSDNYQRKRAYSSRTSYRTAEAEIKGKIQEVADF